MDEIGPRYGAYDGEYWGVEDALRKENRELAAEVRRLRNLVGTWELAALAAMSDRLDPDTAKRVGERMREIVRERSARNEPPASDGGA